VVDVGVEGGLLVPVAAVFGRAAVEGPHDEGHAVEGGADLLKAQAGVLGEDAEAVGGVVPEAEGVVGLELGGAADEEAVGAEYAVDLGEELAGVGDVLEDLVGVDEGEGGGAEGRADAVVVDDGIGPGGTGALAGLGGVADVDAEPVDLGVVAAEEGGGGATAAAEVEDLGRGVGAVMTSST